MESLVAANVRQRPVRALVSAAGVALGVCLVMLFTGLARGMSNDLQRRSSNLRAEIIFTRAGGSEMMSAQASLPVKYAEELLKIEGVEMAVPSIRYFSQGGKGFGFEQVEGVDWNEFAAMNEMRLVAGRAPEGGGDPRPGGRPCTVHHPPFAERWTALSQRTSGRGRCARS